MRMQSKLNRGVDMDHYIPSTKIIIADDDYFNIRDMQLRSLPTNVFGHGRRIQLIIDNIIVDFFVSPVSVPILSHTTVIIGQSASKCVKLRSGSASLYSRCCTGPAGSG